jgi:ribosome biogenesis SPOUT family RNA methylase Rps3
MTTLNFETSHERDLAIAKMRIDGATFSAIAIAVGLSMQRVRTICDERKRVEAGKVRQARLREALESCPLGKQYLKDYPSRVL